MTVTPKQVVVFATDDGRVPFNQWLHNLADRDAVARILARLGRVRRGKAEHHEQRSEV